MPDHEDGADDDDECDDGDDGDEDDDGDVCVRTCNVMYEFTCTCACPYAGMRVFNVVCTGVIYDASTSKTSTTFAYLQVPIAVCNHAYAHVLKVMCSLLYEYCFPSGHVLMFSYSP